MVAELFPEIANAQLRDDEPSCSAAEALERQGPFVNPPREPRSRAARPDCFVNGRISYQGGFVSLTATARVQPLPIDPGILEGVAKTARSASGKSDFPLVPVCRRFWS